MQFFISSFLLFVKAASSHSPTLFFLKVVFTRGENPGPRAVALTALVTDHWIAPTGAALPFISHAGLW